MKFWNKIFGTKKSNNFIKTFKHLKSVGNRDGYASQAYEILEKIDFSTSDSEALVLVKSVNEIHYPTNINSYFEFFFPIVSHILYYKPSFASDLLSHIVGPNFANGISGSQEMIGIIKEAMNYHLNQNKNYVTKEGEKWVNNELHKLQVEVNIEIDKCRKYLKDE